MRRRYEWITLLGDMAISAKHDPDPAHRRWCAGQVRVIRTKMRLNGVKLAPMPSATFHRGCYDCGSLIAGHHTPLCGMTGKADRLDVPAQPGTQWITGLALAQQAAALEVAT